MIKFCNLFSGSSGNCTFLSTPDTNILIDAGMNCKKTIKALQEVGSSIEDIDAIIITHEHIDHIKGLPTISKKYEIPIYASFKTWKMLENLNVPEYCKEVFTPNEQFEVRNLNIFPFSIPHDAVDPCGFSIFFENKKVTIATDLGYIDDKLLMQMENSDILMLESNYDTETLKYNNKYPFVLKQRISGKNGHLSNDMASKAITHLCQKGVNNFILGHLSKENNFPELAYQTVINELQGNNISINSFNLSVASRDKIDSMLELA